MAKRDIRQAGYRLILNESGGEHAEEINQMLRKADTFDCIIAFAKNSGLKKIRDRLEERLERGLKATFVIGLDFYLTDPGLLKTLYGWSKSFGDRCSVYVGGQVSGETFHPKIYQATSGGQTSLIVGSANLTLGGLANNHEASVLLRIPGSDVSVKKAIEQLLANEYVESLTQEIMDKYRKDHALARATYELAERKVRRLSQEEHPSGIETLAEILAEMKRDKTDWGFAQSTERRRLNRIEARRILDQIADHENITSEDFRPLYEKLLDRWHSGGLNRGKTGIIAKPKRFQRIVRLIRASADIPLAELYESINSLAKGAKGVRGMGPNVITEILHAHDNQAYAVMNANSSKGMRVAGYDFPEKPKKNLVGGRMYAEFCSRALEIGRELGLKDMTELDALFNYAYWSWRPDEDDDGEDE